VLELKHARKAYGDLVVFEDVNLHVERGDRIALVGPNGAGKSTLVRMLSGEEQPDSGERLAGHNVVMEYFAQDEATRMPAGPTVYETLVSGSPTDMVPAVRNILGGFLFSGDDIYKRVGVLSGGERTRLAVARMLLRPSNTLILDEPTNHLDLDSKDVLLDALADYGGTLIFVSHDRYFVERLATKIVEIGDGQAIVYPGTYREFLWHKTQRHARTAAAPQEPQRRRKEGGPTHEEKKRADADARKRARAAAARRSRIDELEARIADAEQAIRDLEAKMAAPGFYDDRAAAQSVVDEHRALMWKVGDLMHQWEELQSAPELTPTSDR
jgi:ATP-binding cassette subfamily F protein 3